MSDNLYIRNLRPNRIVIKYSKAKLRFHVDRRGTRNDTLALPIDAKTDADIARWLRIGQIEEITQEQYMELSAREVDGVEQRVDTDVFKKQPSVALPNRDYNEELDLKMPNAIPKKLLDDMNFKKETMSPKLEFADEPLSTEEELAALKPQKEKVKK